MGVPIVIEEMGKPYVDIAVLAGFLISLVFLARRKLTPASIVVAGTSAGFMIGAKSFAAFSFLVLFGFLIFRVFLLKSGFPARLRKIEIKSSIRLILTYVVCCILFGGYFYIRNMVLTGNPTAIFKVELMGVELFHGERDVAGTMANAQIVGKGIYEALHSGREFPLIMAGLFDPQRYFHTIGGGGALWIVLMIPAILFAVVYAVIRRRWLLVAIVISCIIPMLCFKYDRVMMRYYIQIIGAGTTAFGYLLTLLSRTRYRRLLLSIAVVLMGLMISLTSPPTGWRVKVDDIRLARSAPYMARDRYVYYHSWGDPRFANALKIVVQPGTTLALADELPGYANLAGWNAGYSNRVVWVAWPGSGDEWESNLRKAGAQAIYVSNSNDGLGWAKSHPSSFETVYESSNLGAIFKLVPVDTGQ
jgi:predicted membrane protein